MRSASADDALPAIGDLERLIATARAARASILRAAGHRGPGDRAAADADDEARVRLIDVHREASSMGVILRDPEAGYIDIVTVDGSRERRCWRLGEREISFVHAVDAGCGARRPG